MHRIRNPLFYGLRRIRDPRNYIAFTPGTRTESRTGSRTAWVFSYTGVSNEPRVLRQTRALVDAGWRVVVFGYDGHSPRPPEWHFARLPADSPHALHFRYALTLVRGFALALAKFAPVHALRSTGARLYHASIPHYRWFHEEVARFQREHPELKPDLVIAHDYFTADVAYAAATACSARFAVDCHEYARGQYMHDPRWVRWIRPYVRVFQDYYLERADAVTTVCDGIRDLLNAEQRLKRPARTVRSVPFKNVQPFRSTGDRITVIYLGDISYMRGLHKAIKSMPLWRPEFDMVIQGSVSRDYASDLKRIAAELGVADRVHLRPAVPFSEIVPSANQADIGYFVHNDVSPQKRFALPNKFFEYVMAGLALCVSDLPEMAKLVRQYDLGRLVPRYDERAIADAINSFDRAGIDAMKRNSIAAAAELNWDVEQQKMLSLYEEITA